MSSNLFKRILFALWAVPLGWLAVNARIDLLVPAVDTMLGGAALTLLPGQLVCIIITFIAIQEYCGMLSRKYPYNGFWLVHVWVAFQFIVYIHPSESPSMNTIYPLVILVAIEAFVWGRPRSRWKRASLLLSATLFICIAGISLLDLWQKPLQILFPPGKMALFLRFPGTVTVLASVFLCDTGAYFIGKYFGTHRVAPHISPHKTLEGSIAGFCCATVVSAAGWYFFADTSFPRFAGVFLGMLIGIFATAGDLTVSTIKRYFDVKDSSKIIPGHGGILDRFDSLFFTAPLVGLFLLLIEKFAL